MSISIGQKGKRVVDLCKWIDENAYKENVDKEILFDSLFRCVTLICIKNKLFSNWSDYEPFGLYASTRLYLRLINEKQFQLDENSEPKMKRIKSILNFIKKTLRPMIVDFQQKAFKEEFRPEIHGEDFINSLKDGLLYQARCQFSDKIASECVSYFESLPKTVWQVVMQTPYQNDKLITHCLYVSCLLTLLNQITLSNHNKRTLKEKLDKNFKVDEFVNIVYDDESKDATLLYGIDESLKNYVATLVNIIKNNICVDLKHIVGDNQPTDAVLDAVISSQYENAEDSL